MKPKLFLIIVALLAGPYLLCVGYFAATEQQPFDGDLTRISALSEASFGWNEPQEAYKAEYHFPTSRSLDAYDQPYDIIVAGDSFSFRTNTSWINTLIEKTGMSVLALHVNGTSISQIIRHPMFIQSPPKYFIFESVERRLYDRLELLDVPAEPLKTSSQAPSEWSPITLERQKLKRTDTFSSIEQRFAHAVHVIRIKLGCFIDASNCKVVMKTLKAQAPELFSSAEKKKIVLLEKDFSSRRKWDQRRPEALRRLNLLQEYFAAAPETEFTLLVYPDKLSVYAEFIDSIDKPATLIPEIAELIKIPRLDIAFRQAILDGQKDIYLPNNSHSGGWANILAGELVAEHLTNE